MKRSHFTSLTSPELAKPHFINLNQHAQDTPLADSPVVDFSDFLPTGFFARVVVHLVSCWRQVSLPVLRPTSACLMMAEHSCKLYLFSTRDSVQLVVMPVGVVQDAEKNSMLMHIANAVKAVNEHLYAGRVQLQVKFNLKDASKRDATSPAQPSVGNISLTKSTEVSADERRLAEWLEKTAKFKKERAGEYAVVLLANEVSGWEELWSLWDDDSEGFADLVKDLGITRVLDRKKIKAVLTLQ